ncbi:NUDIX hydrolase [candidate division KSB1 bacterium]|nr:NUDIX hydrolase [candidate division KSB1 bacterium]
MPILKHKVFAYITHGHRLLVFRHADFPKAGIQVPAGTIQPNERPDEAVLREVYEETGYRISPRFISRLLQVSSPTAQS